MTLRNKNRISDILFSLLICSILLFVSPSIFPLLLLSLHSLLICFLFLSIFFFFFFFSLSFVFFVTHMTAKCCFFQKLGLNCGSSGCLFHYQSYKFQKKKNQWFQSNIINLQGVSLQFIQKKKIVWTCHRKLMSNFK